jgi:AcrR family transcriptional regulator
MTRHRSREARTREILEAAAAEIDERGYASLTMDALAERTTLSKGGIYRYMPSKEALTLALFEEACRQEADFDLDEVLGWGLPLVETMLRLLVPPVRKDWRWLRVWLQLIPEVLVNARFREKLHEIEGYYEARYVELTTRLVARDAIPVRPDFERRVGAAVRLGTTLMEGVALRTLSEVDRGEVREQVTRFLEVLLRDALGPDDEVDDV